MKPLPAAVVMLVCLWGAVARAQVNEPAAAAETTRTERPFRGLFGETTRTSARKDVFDVRFSLAGSYDDNVLADQGLQIPDPRLNTNGYYGLAFVDATYEHRGRTLSVGATGGSSVRYYADLKDATSVESHADVHMNLTLGKTRVALSQGAENTPYYGFRFFPNVGSDEYAMPSDGVQPVRSTQTYLFSTTAAITQTLTTRSELFASYALRYTDFARPGTTDLTAHSARGGYRYQLTRYAAFRAGYGIEQGTYGYAALAQDGRTRLDTIDLGVDYRRPLSFSRRTRVDFGVGTTAADVPLGGRVYRLVGDAGLTHEIGRTWNLRASVHRGTALIEGIAGPVFSDAGTVSFAGFVNRRIDVHTEGSYTTGEVGMTGERSPFDSTNGLGRLRFALSRKVALFSEYSYYRYHFRSAAALPTGLPPNLRRQGVRVGVTLFVPVLH